jgi:hypothetical protein
MGGGGVWRLTARYPERWRVARRCGTLHRQERIVHRLHGLPIFMTEVQARSHRSKAARSRRSCAQAASFEYLEVDGDHGGMVPMVWPAIFDLRSRVRSGRAKAP